MTNEPPFRDAQVAFESPPISTDEDIVGRLVGYAEGYLLTNDGSPAQPEATTKFVNALHRLSAQTRKTPIQLLDMLNAAPEKAQVVPSNWQEIDAGIRKILSIPKPSMGR